MLREFNAGLFPAKMLQQESNTVWSKGGERERGDKFYKMAQFPEFFTGVKHSPEFSKTRLMQKINYNNLKLWTKLNLKAPYELFLR